MLVRPWRGRLLVGVNYTTRLRQLARVNILWPSGMQRAACRQRITGDVFISSERLECMTHSRSRARVTPQVILLAGGPDTNER